MATPLPGSRNDIALDQPIWQALSTLHAHLAEGDALAKRYPVAITLLAGVREPSAAAFEALARLLAPGDTVALFLESLPTLADGWKVVNSGVLAQMICTAPALVPPPDGLEALDRADVDEMVSLATLTRPGPFGPRTYELSGYHGIRQDGQLAAMAGQRLRLPGFTEISAVCTHPEHRGHGYASALVSVVAAQILERGDTPFLHVRESNTAAIGVYRKLGFEIRRMFHFVVLQRESAATVSAQ